MKEKTHIDENKIKFLQKEKQQTNKLLTKKIKPDDTVNDYD